MKNKICNFLAVIGVSLDQQTALMRKINAAKYKLKSDLERIL
jgi:hypothetical protein